MALLCLEDVTNPWFSDVWLCNTD